MKKISLFVVLLTVAVTSVSQQNGKDWYRFSDDGKECIVYKSDLPTPWLNRLSNDAFSAWITHNGFIEAYMQDPHSNGLINPQDVSGRFYLRDRQANSYFQVNKPVAGGQWEARVGLGYNIVSNSSKGISCNLTYFIPRNGDNVLLIKAQVKNATGEMKTLDLTGEVEWNLGDPVKSLILRGDGRGGNSQLNLYKKVEWKNDALLAELLSWPHPGVSKPWTYTGFFSASDSVTSFETIKSLFLGNNLDYNHPAALESPSLSNTGFWSEAQYPLGVLQCPVNLKPGEQKTIVFTLGMAGSKEQAIQLSAKYKDKTKADTEFQNLKKFFDEIMSNSTVIETPDKANDRIINVWTKYMWRQFIKLNKDSSGYGQGVWSYGIEGGSASGRHPELYIVPVDTALMKNCVRNLLRDHVFDTTDVKIPHRHLVVGYLSSVYHYLLETGDWDLFREELPYLNGQNAAVWVHVRAALSTAVKALSKRGLPRTPGDWNDEFTLLNMSGNAESVMAAGEYGYFLKVFSEIASRMRQPADSAAWMSGYERIKKAMNELAWDGNWYVRSFSDRADPMPVVGSNENEEGKIYLNSQSWAIISGVASRGRADTSLAAVKKILISDYGPMLFWPPYSHPVDYIGTQSLYGPGFRNSCIYLRPAAWAIIAARLNNDLVLAHEMYDKAKLSNVSKDIERYQCEPYVYAENYNGPPHRLAGKGEFQWNFGEGAAWMYASYVNYILGIRPTLEGLLLDPAIPNEWDGYKVRRPFRGNTYEIEVRNPQHRSSGVRSVTVNGKKIKGRMLNYPPEGKTYKVVVGM